MRRVIILCMCLVPSLSFAHPKEIIENDECVYWEDEDGRHPCPAPENAEAYWLDDEGSRCALYRERVEKVLASEGVSTNYYALAMAESRCKLSVVSDKGAIGFWQMMPATMKAYGCTDASDLECQTRAAARYIKHIEEVVGTNEEDVVKAYNMGAHNYLKRGSTKQADGLYYTYKKYKKQIDKV